LQQANIRRNEEEKAVSPVIATILMVAITVVLAGVLYVWANNLASEGTDTSVGTLNTYTTEDAEDETGPGADDTLVKMQLTGKDDLAWSFVKITVSVGDNVYTCSVVAGDDCEISQAAGDNDNAWEPGEYLFLSEGNDDICSEADCLLKISVTHNGRTVAGDGVSGQGGNIGNSGGSDSIDTTPPVITVPDDQTFTAPDSDGYYWEYGEITATDNSGVVNGPVCMAYYPTPYPSSGGTTWSLTVTGGAATFPVGTTTIHCTATDGTWGDTGCCSANEQFTVTVMPRPGMFVAVGGQIGIITSADGTSWSNPSSGLDYFRGITYGNDLLVAVGDGGEIATSTNGTGWTSRTSGTTTDLNDAAYGNGVYVAVGNSGTIQSSSDGVSWTSETSGTTKNLRDVAYGNSLFVAVGQSGKVLSSTDGSSWTTESSGTSTQALEGVIYGNGKFVAVGYSDTIITSSDGSSWSSESSGTTSKHFMDVSYGGGKYVVVSTVNNGAVIITSSDAESWTTQESGITEHVFGVTYGDGTHVTAGTNHKMYHSSNGASWSLADTTGLWGHYYGVTYLP